MKKLAYLVLLAVPLAGCSDVKETWNKMWNHEKEAPPPPPPAITVAPVVMHLITAKGEGKEIGTITLTDTPGGLSIVADLKGLPAGKHGFHVHENADCSPGKKDGKVAAGMAAGGHFDPMKTGKHMGPMGEGHEGDLPYLTVAKNHTATETLVAPHLKVADVKGHAIVIHKGGDNYSDKPKPLGGGGERIACGVAQ
jgi:Cu-Zn family superoxide dismutase